MARKLVTIIIPVRQEEETIRKTIRAVETCVRTPHSICIADDTVDSQDKTLILAKKALGSKGVIVKKPRHAADGFGPALVRAVRRTTTPYCIFVMADSADNLKDIDRMVAWAKEKDSDVVVGCRYMRGGRKMGGPILQGIFSRMLNIFLYTVLRVPTRDSTNAFKLYKTAFVKKIVPTSPAIGIEFSLELLLRAVECGAKIIDMPTVWRGRTEGVSKVNIIPRGIRYMGVVEAWFLKT